jgi:hypothetical protein
MAGVEPPVRLVNGEAAHRADPRTYSIPRRVVRESLRPGDLVKLGFVTDSTIERFDVERMWVRVDEVLGSGYRGRLDNVPGHIAGLTLGDLISFGPEHVIARWTPPDDPLYTDPAQFAVVSRLVWDSDHWPGRLERRALPDPTFSGWFVLAGDEASGYLADPNNFLPIPAAALFDRFRVVSSGMEGPIGTQMAWSEADSEYKVVG